MNVKSRAEIFCPAQKPKYNVNQVRCRDRLLTSPLHTLLYTFLFSLHVFAF